MTTEIANKLGFWFSCAEETVEHLPFLLHSFFLCGRWHCRVQSFCLRAQVFLPEWGWGYVSWQKKKKNVFNSSFSLSEYTQWHFISVPSEAAFKNLREEVLMTESVRNKIQEVLQNWTGNLHFLHDTFTVTVGTHWFSCVCFSLNPGIVLVVQRSGDAPNLRQ